MGHHARSVAIAILALLCAQAASARASPQTPQIRISAVDSQSWRVGYHFKIPVSQLVFARSPDDSRTRNWKTSADFELIAAPEGERARRRDGGVFTDISFEVPPVYSVLPKDYAPFSPFGDGSLLFHTGRFFACADVCPNSAQWRMQLTAPPGRHILLNGQRKLAGAAWLDSDEGRNIYLGDDPAMETADLIAVIDAALPETVKSALIAQLPQFMHFFSQRLGRLHSRPMLFASYDVSHQHGSGRQGGTLAGEVFVHFYGKIWPERMQKAGFAEDLAWHFAHEAAHLYQQQKFSDQDAWIHEGSAEAFAALAIQATRPDAGSFVEGRIEHAHDSCGKSPIGEPMREKMRANGSALAYDCGLILNLAIDSTVRRVSPGSDGLYTVWKDYIRRTTHTEQPGENAFLAAVVAASTADVADSVRRALDSETIDALSLN